jgi:predicted dithiol-disulfide oxidoreductase (DUF899 family)
LISRAPLAKLDAYKSSRSWNLPWWSSFGSDFNYDFHVSLDPDVAPLEYNYKTKSMTGGDLGKGEGHGLSVFFRLGVGTIPYVLHIRTWHREPHKLL